MASLHATSHFFQGSISPAPLGLICWEGFCGGFCCTLFQGAERPVVTP